MNDNWFRINGVGGGIRTLGHWNHNPALYQLSYTHREDVSILAGRQPKPQIERFAIDALDFPNP